MREVPATPVAFVPWLESILAPWESEIRQRSLRFRFEVDTSHLFETDAALEAAWAELLRMIFATAPDESEIYFGSSRSAASVSTLGGGQWSARWQVCGISVVEGGPIPLRPRAGDAKSHATSPLAERVRGLFAQTRWDFILEGLDARDELLARATLR